MNDILRRDPLLALIAILAAAFAAAAGWRIWQWRAKAGAAGGGAISAMAPQGSASAEIPLPQKKGDLTAAKRLLAAGEFAAAERCARDAAVGANAAEALRLAEQCATFQQLVSEMTPRAEEAGEICEVTLRPGGKPIIARVISAENGLLHIRPEGGIGFTRRREEIDGLRMLTEEEISRRHRERLVEAKIIASADGVSLALLGLQAWAYGLKAEASSLLQEAIKADHDLVRSLAEHRARQLLRHGIWMQSVGASAKGEEIIRQVVASYPNTRAASSAQEILKETSGAPPLAPKAAAARLKAEDGAVASPAAPRSAGDLTVADQELRRAKALLAEAQETVDAKDSDRCYAEAVKLLERARAVYEAACEKNPDDAKLGRRLEEIQAQLYWARKLQRL